MYERERKELIDKLSQKGIWDQAVLKAIGKVERHKFLSKAFHNHAYKDIALPIGYGQSISQPYTVAFMTQELHLKPNSKVLEIGTGSGYQAAILVHMKMQVYSIERNIDLYLKTRNLFDSINLRVHSKYGDGTIGWAEYSPYDGIIVTAGSPSVPEPLKKQIAIGGKLVIPVGNKNSQKLKILTKLEEDVFDERDEPEFSFVPLIGREGWNTK